MEWGFCLQEGWRGKEKLVYNKDLVAFFSSPRSSPGVWGSVTPEAKDLKGGDGMPEAIPNFHSNLPLRMLWGKFGRRNANHTLLCAPGGWQKFNLNKWIIYFTFWIFFQRLHPEAYTHKYTQRETRKEKRRAPLVKVPGLLYSGNNPTREAEKKSDSTWIYWARGNHILL